MRQRNLDHAGGRRGGLLSRGPRSRRCCLAVAVTVIVVAGCVDDGSTDGAAEPEGSPSTVPSSTVGSMAAVTTPSTRAGAPAPVTSGDEGGDEASAAFTRSRFDNVNDADPGCTVAIGHDGEVVFAEAYGAAHLDPVEPMTADTLVDIGSVSKQFTATAILLLAERGAVDLAASLATYLPALPAWASRPTLSQLLHHQSGIPDYIGLLLDRGASLTGPSTIADALAALGAVPDLEFAPGTRWEYSNSNYFLLSQVVHAVTGQDLGSFLTGEVFAPLALEMVLDPTS